ncbi:hypothetical protein LJR175_008253 [Variovorax sp. LjRoot175]|uniref:hypothetical protein n=1 Tax=Variovorax sp. LjRoot175 TaxID=3342276 RepID=UPI003ED16BF5
MPLIEPEGGSVEERLERLKHVVESMRCPDDRHETELRKRTFSNGSCHLVQQCMRCGRQIGGAIGKRAPRPAQEPEEFDQAIERRYGAVSSEYSALLSERLMDRTAGEALPSEVVQDRRQCLGDSFDELLASSSAGVEESEALDIFAGRIGAARARRRQILAKQIDRFESEEQLRVWLVQHLSGEFDLHPEVPGRHLAEGVGVRIDYLAVPKPHLVNEGFAPEPFGIEVKHINPLDGFTRRASRALWQTISYTDSAFDFGPHPIRLRFAVLFSNLAFEAERQLLKHDDFQQWHAFTNLAHHSNVGTLEIKGDKNKCDGWFIAFSSGNYFYRRSIYGGDVVYVKPSTNTINKMRIGNF